jgi:hypothetical protein
MSTQLLPYQSCKEINPIIVILTHPIISTPSNIEIIDNEAQPYNFHYFWHHICHAYFNSFKVKVYNMETAMDCESQFGFGFVQCGSKDLKKNATIHSKARCALFRGDLSFSEGTVLC